MIERITIERIDAPHRIEIGIYVPGDVADLPDIQYVEYDGNRLEPVDNETASQILGGMSQVMNGITSGVSKLAKENDRV